MRLLARAVVALVLLAVGAATAVATVAVAEIGWGLPLAVVATLLTVVALPPGWWTRLPFCLGWTLLIAWVVSPRPEGDYVISSDAPGYVVVVLALLLLVAGIATLPRPRRRRPAPPAEPTDPAQPAPPASERGGVGAGT